MNKCKCGRPLVIRPMDRAESCAGCLRLSAECKCHKYDPKVKYEWKGGRAVRKDSPKKVSEGNL